MFLVSAEAASLTSSCVYMQDSFPCSYNGQKLFGLGPVGRAFGAQANLWEAVLTKPEK